MVSTKFYKGEFEGLFQKKKELHKGKFNFYSIKWEHVNITKIEVAQDVKLHQLKAGAYHFTALLKSRKSKIDKLLNLNTSVFIPHNIDKKYTGDLQNFLVRDLDTNERGIPVLTRVSPMLFQVKGTAYFSVTENIPIITKPIIGSPGVGNGENNLGEIIVNTPNRLLRILNGFKSQTQPQTNTPQNTKTKSGGCLSRLATSLVGGIVGLLLYYLWYSNTLQFGLLTILCALWLIGQLFGKGWLSKTMGWSILIYLIFYYYDNKHFIKNELKPQKTEDGSVKIYPPEEDLENTDPSVRDFMNKKELHWWDFLKKQYHLVYSTSSVNFRKSTENRVLSIPNNAQDETQFYSSLYNKLNQYDNKYLDSFVANIQQKRKEATLNPPQTAEMVITMIQEIPYVLVHDLSCSKIVANSDNDFIRDYHSDNKPCMPNIAAGVQSPYEFTHNLKGDCDTRALLGHTILKRLGIASSIWISTVYGHSVLGVGVYSQGSNYKIAGNVKHYAVELTAKGYRLGMIAAEHRNMNNWIISNYNN